MRKNSRASNIIIALALAMALSFPFAGMAAEPAMPVPKSPQEIPMIPGAYVDEQAARKLLEGYSPDHFVYGTLRSRQTAVFYVDMVVDDATRWYEKMLGYPVVTLDDLSGGAGVAPGSESPIYYWYDYYTFPDSNGFDDYGKLIWPGEFVTKMLAENRRTWQRGSILQQANYGWFFKDMDNSVTDCLLIVMDAGFDFEAMTYSKKTAVIISWEVYEPFSEADLEEEYDPELAEYIRDVEDFAAMLLADPPTPKMLDVPIHEDMYFDPFTTAMYMMDGDPMYTFFWDIDPEEAVRNYSEQLMLKPEQYDDGWVFVFSGRLPYPMHALFIYPNSIQGVPFKTVVFVRKEVVTR